MIGVSMPSTLREDRGGAAGGSGLRPIVYCLVPAELSAKLHEPLRGHFAENPNVQVVVERRREDRRRMERRDASSGAPAMGERRVRDVEGRRAGERRAPVFPIAEPPPLPRRLRRHADQVVFVQRLEPAAEEAEDRDTARLVARFKDGDREAFSALYIRYYDRVYSYLRVVLRRREEAEDAAQDVFTTAFRKLPETNLHGNFRAWLWTSARNRAIDILRRQGRIQVEENATIERRREANAANEAEETPFIPALGWIRDPDLLLFVERLPLAQRQVLVLRYLLDLPVGEAAAILGRTPDDVRALQYRAFEVLRDRLAAVGRAPERKERPAKARGYVKQATVLRKRRFSLLNR